MFSLNINKQGRSIASFWPSIAIAAVFAVAIQAQASAQVQTEDDIVNLVNAASGKCLQPISQSHNQGDAIVQQTCNGSAAQQWTIRSVSGAKIHVINKESGLCLDARGKAIDGTPIQQWPCNQISNENWSRGSNNNSLVSEVTGTSSHCIATPGNQDGLPMSLRQCNGDASQIWKADHASAAACAGRSGNGPLDLSWSDCDPNGFRFNPEWVYQATNSGRLPPGPIGVCPAATSSHVFPSACVSWPVTYDSQFYCGPHVNYFAVTYQGPVDWVERSGWYEDDDYNFNMYPPNNAGMFLYPPSAGQSGLPQPDPLEIEFDSRETINNFRSLLWTNFHQMVDNNNSTAQAYVKGHTAVVTSLFGLDCGHSSCSSEEHPAYAMAVDMDDSNPDDDQWAVFARNWGDEGFCGSQEHFLPLSNLKVRIPWLSGATAVSVLVPKTQFNLFENFSNQNVVMGDARSNATVPPSPQITVAKGEGILIDFMLPDPSQEQGWEGEVHLQWTVPPAIRSTLTARMLGRRAGAPARPAKGEDEDEKPETRIRDLFTRLPAQQQAAIRASFAAPSGTAQPAAARPSPPMRPVLTVAKLPAPPRRARLVVPQAVNNPELAQKNQAARQALCAAFKNNVPGYPSICSAAGRGH